MALRLHGRMMTKQKAHHKAPEAARRWNKTVKRQRLASQTNARLALDLDAHSFNNMASTHRAISSVTDANREIEAGRIDEAKNILVTILHQKASTYESTHAIGVCVVFV